MKSGPPRGKNHAEPIRTAIAAFEAVTWSSCGDPGAAEADEGRAGWVKFGLQKTELGWRTLEFLVWVCDDMIRAGERLFFFPTAPPPYLNTPGECLSFVLEIHPYQGDEGVRFPKVAEFINFCREKYWAECKK